MKETHFISCDWGSSNFRLRLVEIPTLQVLAEIQTNDGIAAMHKRWTTEGNNDQGNKESFYLQFLAEALGSWKERMNDGHLPIVVSGMASSTLGIKDLQYASIPYALSGEKAVVEWINFSPEPPYRLLLVSGVRSDDDVMRGEETQMSGLLQQLKPAAEGSSIYILPGTHSKHIVVRDNKIIGFKTYMTGELFSLMSNQSMLRNSVQVNSGAASDAESVAAFESGVSDSSNDNLLHNLFMVRTNQLFEKFSPVQNSSYLSGLIIGAELQTLKGSTERLVLAGASSLITWYEIALKYLRIDSALTVVSSGQFDQALLAGQLELLKTNLR